MTDLEISSLVLRIDEDTSGQEHRIRPIAVRASVLFAEMLGRELRAGGAPRAQASNHSSGTTAPLGLASCTDEQAARRIAHAWLEAVGLHLKV